jgi:hypothetical protein
LRLFGTGRVLRPDDAEFESLRTHFAELVDVERIADACGYAVPYYELVDERPVLDAYHSMQPDEKYARQIATGAASTACPHSNPTTRYRPYPASNPRAVAKAPARSACRGLLRLLTIAKSRA